MKKLLTLLLALVFSCSCVSALAVSEQYTISTSFKLDENALFTLKAVEPSEENFEKMDLIVSLINAIGFKSTVTQEGMEFSFTLKNKAVMTTGLYLSETGLTLLSDMFPHYGINVDFTSLIDLLSSDDMQQLLSTYVPDDTDARLAELLQMFTAVSEKFTQRAVYEKGTYTENGMAFDEKVTLDTLAIAHLVIDTFEIAINNDTIFSMLQQEDESSFPDKATALATISEAAAQLEGITPEEASSLLGLGLLDIVLYRNSENGDRYFTLSVKETYGDTNILTVAITDGKLHMQVLTSNGDYTTPASIARAAKLGVKNHYLIDLSLARGATEKEWSLAVDTYINERYIDPVNVYLTGKVAPLPLSGYAMELGYANASKADPLVKLNVVIMPTGKLALKNSLTPETIITVDPVAFIEDADAALTALQTELEGLLADVTNFGSVTLMSNALNAMPEEIGAFITLLVQSNLI